MPAAAKRVVTAYLWDGRRVLLALRSERASTFPNHWAAISGYIENESPLQRAFIEIAEETGLSRSQAVLRRAGERIVVESNQGAFEVHPFLFSVSQGTNVRADWEARRLEWVDLDEVLSERRSPTVPRLSDALRAVWPPSPAYEAIDANVDATTIWLRDDRSMGASTLARTTAREVAKLIPLCEVSDWPGQRARLADAARGLASVRPSMAPLGNLLNDVAEALRLAKTAQDGASETQRLIERSQLAAHQAAQRAADRIADGERVLTISYSGTVLETLLLANDKLREVLVCEGRPLNEGWRLASQLADHGIAATVLTDAQAFSVMNRVDRVLIGADAVTADGCVVNKVGSALIALAARRFGKPFAVVCESLKQFRGGDAQPPSETNPPAEVWNDPPPGVHVLNEYFELVPRDLVDELITETEG